MSTSGKCSVASKIPFSDFCKHCEKFHNAPKTKKSELIRNYMSYFRDFAEKFKTKNDNADISFYPVLRLLVPQAERERGAYGIKEPTLAKILIRVLNISKEANDAKKLLHYKAPTSGASSSGDFAEVAYFVLKVRCAEKGTLTVEDVNTHLDNIAIKHAEHVQRGVDEELITMIRAMTALEVKWLIRIILKDMKFNIAQNTILKLYHIDAPELFDVSNSLFKVCATLYNLSDRLHKLEIELFNPFRPMLSKRLDIAEINKYFKTNLKYYLETKFDGERFQIHMLDGRYQYFSRNGFNFSQEFGASSTEGMLTPKLVYLLKSSPKSFIIDGEMMGWNKNKQCFGSKGMNFDVKKLLSDSVHQPCFCVFDILYLNNEVLTDKPLSERLKLLKNLFEEKEGVLMLSKRKEATAVEHVIDALNVAIDNNEEGIVMKTLDSIYKPNNRNAGWFKIKPEYTAGVLSELDLLIIGGYYGEGKAKVLITSFLLGVAVDDESGEVNSTPRMFHSVGRVGIGFTAEEMNDLARTLHPHWTTVTGSKKTNRRIRECPPNLAWTKEVPDVWIEPKNSCVLQVKATELVRTTAFKTNYTLRFPRVEKIRYDKPWHSCMTLSEFNGLIKNFSSVEKLTSRHVNLDDIDMNIATDSKSSRKRIKIDPVPASLQLDTKKIKIVSKILDGKEFCVLSENSDLTKPEIEKKIIENGGTVVQNAGPNTYCALAGKITVRVTNHINLASLEENENSTDVIHVSWLLRVIEKSAFVTYRPYEVLGATEKTNDELLLLYDCYGDSFTEDSDLEQLRKAMDKIDELEHGIVPLQKEKIALDEELFEDGRSPYSPLRNVIAYLMILPENDMNVSDYYLKCVREDIVKNDLKILGARILEEPDGSVTHVVKMLKDSENRENDERLLNEKIEQMKSQMPNLKVVTPEWIEECLEKRCHVEVSL